MFVVKTEDTRFFPKKTTEKIGKEFVQSQQWKIWKMMFLSKRYNNQVVEPMQGNDLTQTSQHSPPKVQDHKPQGFAKDSAPKKILYPPIPPNFSSRTSQGATNYTSLKLTAEAQGNMKKHPKKNQFPKCRQFQGIHLPISPPTPGSNLPSCNKHSPKILAQHWPDASVALLAMAKSQNIWMLCCHQPMASNIGNSRS